MKYQRRLSLRSGTLNRLSYNAGAMVANPEDIDIDMAEEEGDEDMAEETEAPQEKSVPVSTLWQLCRHTQVLN